LAFALSLYMYGCHIQSSGKRGQPKWKGKKWTEPAGWIDRDREMG
jgi:hypothetical protein